jgi:hypothetical protein
MLLTPAVYTSCNLGKIQYLKLIDLDHIYTRICGSIAARTAGNTALHDIIKVIKESDRNVTIRQQMRLEETIMKDMEQEQLKWYGHVQRIGEARLLRITLRWMPK